MKSGERLHVIYSETLLLGESIMRYLNKRIVKCITILFLCPVLLFCGCACIEATNEPLLKSDCRIKNIIWKTIGVGVGGAIAQVREDPNDINTLYCLADMGGLFKSEDGGNTWTNLSALQTRDMDGWYAGGRGSFAICSQNSRILYAVTSDTFRGGIAKSEDGGQTWRMSLDLRNNQKVNWYSRFSYYRAMKVDPENDNKVVAALGSDLYVTSNGGQTWKLAFGLKTIQDHYKNVWIRQVLIDASSARDNRGIFLLANESSSSPFAHCGLDLWYGTKEGGWEIISSKLPHKKILNMTGAKDETGRFVLWVLLPQVKVEGRWIGGLYKSADHGQSWQSANKGLPFSGKATNGFRRQTCKGNLIAEICQRHPQTAYLVTTKDATSLNVNALYRTDDYGKTWRRIEPLFERGPVPGVFHPTHRGLLVSPSDPERLYFMDNVNAHISTDGGKTFRQLLCDVSADGQIRSRGVENTVFVDMAVDPQNPKRVYFGGMDHMFLRTENKGATFYLKKNFAGNTISALAVDPESPKRIYLGTSGYHYFYTVNNTGGFYISDDYGKAWSLANSAEQGKLPFGVVADILVDKQNSNRIFVSLVGKGLFVSQDRAKNWKHFQKGLPEALLDLKSKMFIKKIKQGCDEGKMYLLIYRPQRREWMFPKVDNRGPCYSALYRSLDAGQSWDKVMEQNEKYIDDIILDPHKPNHLYYAGTGGVFESWDGCKTWNCVFNTKTKSRRIRITSLTAHPLNSKIMFATLALNSDITQDELQTRWGIWMTHNSGKTWKPVNSGLGGSRFYQLVIPAKDPWTAYTLTSSHAIYKGRISYEGIATPVMKPVGLKDKSYLDFEKWNVLCRGKKIRVKKTEEAIQIDGDLRERSWENAHSIGKMYSLLKNLQPVPEQIRFSFLYDEEYLYLGFQTEDPGIGQALKLSKNLPEDTKFKQRFIRSVDLIIASQENEKHLFIPIRICPGKTTGVPYLRYAFAHTQKGWTLEAAIKLRRLSKKSKPEIMVRLWRNILDNDWMRVCWPACPTNTWSSYIKKDYMADVVWE